jgi:CheY-like chemotaxis protein
MPKLMLLSGDLMLAARVEGAARQCGLELVQVADCALAVADCTNDCRVVLLDLRNAGIDVQALVEQLRQQPLAPAIVACGPHVHEQLLAEARQAGCDLVVTRGQFDRDAEAILQQFAAS